ncbi:hypothetical protein DFH28DRAFT_946995 [Melampsora americana]|nr:hypothetical protein DFH28DRAFT_946995 [Melampsora americana]
MFMDAEDPHYWNSKRNKIRCYCHKLTLTVKAGLDTIGFEVGQTKPTAPTGKRLRLLLPDDSLLPPKIVLEDGTTLEDDKDVLEDKASTDDISGHPTHVTNDNYEGKDDDNGPNYKDRRPDADLVPQALTKVQRINKLITSSAPRICHFQATAQQLSYKGPGLIGAHGHRWNIWYDAQSCCCQAKQVINFMINLDQEGYYEGITITPDKWKGVEALDKVLEVFLLSTKKMEVDGPTAGSVLFQYSTLIGILTTMKNETSHPAISTMIATMIDQL